MGPPTPITRRQFLRRSFLTTAAIASATACSPVRPSNSPTTGPGPEAIKTLQARLKGRVIRPADPEYERARRVVFWNPRTERHPAMVVRCANEEDVLRSIEFARHHNLELAVRNGGHSFQGWGISNGLVIDLRK